MRPREMALDGSLNQALTMQPVTSEHRLHLLSSASLKKIPDDHGDTYMTGQPLPRACPNLQL